MPSEKPQPPVGRHTTLFAILFITLLALAPANLVAQKNTQDADQITDKKAPIKHETPIKISYSGQIQDGNGNPISGVFPLMFKLYKHQLATDSIWQEEHYVAVVDGRYSLDLGTIDALLPEQLEGNRWMGVEFAGEGEILRDRLIVSLVDPSSSGGNRLIGSASAAPASPNRSTSFAEISERANFAEHAAVADRAEKIGDLDEEAIEKLSNLALERLGEHLTDPDAHKGGKRGGVSTERQVMQPLIGGRGGEAYKVDCPPGFVVTGIEGRAGRVVDSLHIVCSPIQ